jgi:hypothetical protein
MCQESKSAEPCVKIWGPKKQNQNTITTRIPLFEVPQSSDNNPVEETRRDNNVERVSAQGKPSRTLTAYDSSIQAAEVHILERAYLGAAQDLPNDDHFSNQLMVIRLLSCVYGQSIAHPSLRHAIVLFCRPIWSETFDVKDVELSRLRVRRALGRRVNTSMLDEGDIIATWLVACHYFYSGDRVEAMHHAVGFCALINHVLKLGQGFTLGFLWRFLRILLIALGSPDDVVQLQRATSRYTARFLVCRQVYDFGLYSQTLGFWPGAFSNFGALAWSLDLSNLYRIRRNNKDIIVHRSQLNVPSAEIEMSLNVHDQELPFTYFDGVLAGRFPPLFHLGQFVAASIAYHVCQLVLCAVRNPPDGGEGNQFHSRLIAATRLFDFLHRFEDTVDRHISSSINCDPNFITWIKQLVCIVVRKVCGTGQDFIVPLLEDIVHVVAPVPNRGWLIGEFLGFFHWI